MHSTVSAKPTNVFHSRLEEAEKLILIKFLIHQKRPAIFSFTKTFLGWFLFIVQLSEEMAMAARFSYQRLRHESNELDADDIAERLAGRSRTWHRLKRVPVRRRFRLRVPSLKRFLRRKVKVVRLSFARVMKRLKESQAHFGDLFAGNYMFIQVNPTTMKCFDKACGGPGLKGWPSRFSLPRVA